MKVVTVAEMVAVEKQAEHEYGLASPTLMEHAGRSVAEAIQARLEGNVSGLNALVLAGPGNNGGDGRVAARYLGEWGAHVTIYDWKRGHRSQWAHRLPWAMTLPGCAR